MADAASTPVDLVKPVCTGTKTNGTQCTRSPAADSDRCWQHPHAPAPEPSSTGAPALPEVDHRHDFSPTTGVCMRKGCHRVKPQWLIDAEKQDQAVLAASAPGRSRLLRWGLLAVAVLVVLQILIGYARSMAPAPLDSGIPARPQQTVTIPADGILPPSVFGAPGTGAATAPGVPAPTTAP
jgi:hypothetical protein